MTNKSGKIIAACFLLVILAVPIAQMIIEGFHKELPHAFNLFTRIPSEKNLRRFEDDLENKSFIENAVRPVTQYVFYRACRDAGAKALIGKAGWLFYAPNVEYLTGPYYDDRRILMPAGKEPRKNWEAAECISDFKNQLAERGIFLLVVIVPTKPSVYPEYETRRNIEDRTGIHKNTARFAEDLRAKGVEVIDLFPLFINARENGSPLLYLKRDTHWSYEGIRIAARFVGEKIKTYAFYSKLEKTEYELRERQIVRFGDIGEMTQIPRGRILFPAESAKACQVYEKESGKLYRNRKTSNILYLGDSFSRIYQTDNPKGAGIIANLAYELSLPLKAVVNDGGASTKVRKELVRKPELIKDTRLVVWEFVERDIRFGMDDWPKIELPAAQQTSNP